MIKVDKVVKRFDKKTALNELSCIIPNGCVYGLVGANGSGKSTLLRLLTGVFRPDSGIVQYDGIDIFDNAAMKSNLVYVADELFFLGQSSINRMAKFYAACYQNFDFKYLDYLAGVFGLDKKANIFTFSKGMKRQAATILALSCNTEYIFLDETMDGLDPIKRAYLKKVVYESLRSRKASAVITSHSLRELEDTCDQLAMLHEGGIVFESDICNLKTGFFKVQVAFSQEYDRSAFDGIDIQSFSKKGSVATLVARGDREAAEAKIRAMQPLLFELIPLSLEEVFVYEMDLCGYKFDESILDKGEDKNETVRS